MLIAFKLETLHISTGLVRQSRVQPPYTLDNLVKSPSPNSAFQALGAVS